MRRCQRDETGQMNLSEYVSFLQQAERTAPSDSGLRRLAKLAVPPPSRGAVKAALTQLIEPYSRLRARRLKPSATPLRLHLGCGSTRKPGWVNIDLFGTAADLWWNVSKPLPFSTRSVDAIFHEHLLEHLPLGRALALTRECRRVLKAGGTLRVVVPDSEASIASYTNNGEARGALNPERPTALLAASEVFQRHGHRSAYDFETLALLCREAGFEEVERASYGQSRLDPCPDSEHRRDRSLYVESVASA